MLGPDIALEEKDGSFKPLTEILSEELSLALGDDLSRSQNLLQIAQNYSAKFGRNGLECKVHRFYDFRRTNTSAVHEKLAKFPFRLVILSTPDFMLYNAFLKEGKKPVVDRYNFEGENSKLVFDGTPEEPLIFYLYGHIDNPESLILSESDLLDFLYKVAKNMPKLPLNLTSEIRDSNKSFLFLGFGLRYWYLRILLHILEEGRSKVCQSFALEDFTRTTDVDFQNTNMYYSKSEKIQIFNKNANSFVDDLYAKYMLSNHHKTTSSTLVTLASVFICHASEDHATAQFIYNELKTSGFKPWLDSESLSPGEQWNDEIERQLCCAHYVLIINSISLNKKLQGYVNKEIKLALERSDQFRRPLIFVVPVRIDNSDILDELESFHYVDLTNKNNIKKLVDTLKRDLERRKRYGCNE